MTDYLVTATIDGNLPSMKNQRRIVTNRRTGRPMSIRSQDALNYSQSFGMQLPAKARIGYDGPVSIRARVYYRSRRNDLDIEYLKDLLQQNNVILNDRQVVHQEAWKKLSRDNPRVVFTVYKAEEEQ